MKKQINIDRRTAIGTPNQKMWGIFFIKRSTMRETAVYMPN